MARMPNRNPIHPPAQRRPDWRSYQASLKRAETGRGRRRFWIRFALAAALAVSAGTLLAGTGRDLVHRAAALFSTTPAPAPAKPQTAVLDRAALGSLLAKADLVNATEAVTEVRAGEARFRIETSLDTDLQRSLLSALNPKHARYIGVVAMAPATGRILAMVGHNRPNPDTNPCLESLFPAASVFKIVTAAAAIEHCHYTADTPMFYSGRKYTLYKSQLKPTKNRWSNRLSFCEAFAESVNPVFGKIGMHCLNKERLENTAKRFGFNRRLAFEIPLPVSQMVLDQEPYHRAEIACGFNRQTTLTPLHGALIAAALFNDGLMMAPVLVERVRDDNGDVLFRGETSALGRVAGPDTCAAIRRMMRQVVATGTSQKQFRGYRRDRVLKRLVIGGKTGSINNRAQDARFDWFVGFAGEKDGTASVVVSAVVAHEKYIGTRAARYAKLAMKSFFQQQFAENQQTDAAPNRS